MESLFDPASHDRFLARVQGLRPESRRAWGTMDAAQMLSHCALALEAATGDATLSRPLFARLLGRFFKTWLLGPKPFSRNSPTHPMLVMKSPKDFEAEKTRLVAALRKFCAAGPDAAARYAHAFVGTLTGEEWGRMQFKHIDHHLRQFGA
jgi:hypothetical protein